MNFPYNSIMNGRYLCIDDNFCLYFIDDEILFFFFKYILVNQNCILFFLQVIFF